MPASAEKQAAVKAQRLRIYTMRKACMSFADIAEAEGIPEGTAQEYFARAVKRDGLPKLDQEFMPGNSHVAKDDPQSVGAVLANLIVGSATTEPRNAVDKFAKLREVCKDCGLKPAIVTALIRRLEASLAPVLEEGKRYTVAELSVQLEKKIALTLAYMDDLAMSQASFKDLSIGLNVLIEKHQLVNNKPTMIVDQNTRSQLVELTPLLLAEAKRRGVTLDGIAQRVPEVAA